MFFFENLFSFPDSHSILLNFRKFDKRSDLAMPGLNRVIYFQSKENQFSPRMILFIALVFTITALQILSFSQ